MIRYAIKRTVSVPDPQKCPLYGIIDGIWHAEPAIINPQNKQITVNYPSYWINIENVL